MKQLIGTLIVLPISAYIAYLAARPITGFRPRYTNALLSTVAGTVAIWYLAALLGLLLSMLPMDGSTNIMTGIRALAGWLVMSLCHAAILRGPNGERVTPPKAFLLTIVQAVLGLVLIFPIAALLAPIFKR